MTFFWQNPKERARGTTFRVYIPGVERATVQLSSRIDRIDKPFIQDQLRAAFSAIWEQPPDNIRVQEVRGL